MDSRSNQILRKGYLLPGVEHVLGETGLDVARLFLARLLARLRHPLAFAYLLLPPPPLPPHGPIQDGRARCRLLLLIRTRAVLVHEDVFEKTRSIWAYWAHM